MTIKANTFAEACYNNNTIKELKAALKADCDETDIKTWGLTVELYHYEINLAIRVLEKQENA